MSHTGPTPADYLDSEFAAEALAEIVRYGMDNDRSPAEVASNIIAHFKMHAAAPVTADREPTAVTGTVRAHYSNGSECICCPGLHRHGTSFDLDERVSPYDHLNDIDHFVHSFLHGLPDGAKVRVTVEHVEGGS